MVLGILGVILSKIREWLSFCGFLGISLLIPVCLLPRWQGAGMLLMPQPESLPGDLVDMAHLPTRYPLNGVPFPIYWQEVVVKNPLGAGVEDLSKPEVGVDLPILDFSKMLG